MVTNPPSAGARMGTPAGRWVLLATISGSGMALLDATVVNIALPSIGRDFGADFRTLQWIVNAYTLTLAALIPAGRDTRRPLRAAPGFLVTIQDM
jgi:MFS family permease